MTDLESHPVPESVDTEAWRLDVTGAVSQPLTLIRENLTSLPDEQFGEDFTCVEGWRAANLSWTGVRVDTVLSRAAPTADARYVLVHAMDGDYASAFPLDRARNAILALKLDGEPLAVDHGGPVRLIPTNEGADCWESIKWVAELEVTTQEPTTRDTAKERALSRASTAAE